MFAALLGFLHVAALHILRNKNKQTMQQRNKETNKQNEPLSLFASFLVSSNTCDTLAIITCVHMGTSHQRTQPVVLVRLGAGCIKAMSSMCAARLRLSSCKKKYIFLAVLCFKSSSCTWVVALHATSMSS